MMKANSHGRFSRVLACLMAVLMIALLIPMTGSVMGEETVSSKTADEPTLNSWEQYFGSANNTQNTGDIWTDKSVLSDASEFSEQGITLSDADNMLVALSALSSNTNIEGYSAKPTDTMIMLDISGSMAGKEDDLLKAANEAIATLLSINNHNRVGVVVYNYEALTVLPLGRYTTGSDGEYITFTYNSSGTARFVTCDRDVVNEITGATTGEDFWQNRDSSWLNYGVQPGGATFTQSALLLAYNEFKTKIDAGDTVIAEGDFQAGMKRTPVYILMSDGAPTFATGDYATVKAADRVNGWRELGNGNYQKSHGIAFLTQLTASFARTATERGTLETDGSYSGGYETDALFYTLGFGVDDQECAHAVVNPEGATADLWEQFNDSTGADGINALYMDVDVVTYSSDAETSGYNSVTVEIQRRHPNVMYSDYVTEYYSADNINELMANFELVVEEILVQSRYYPTLVSGLDPNADGYLSFVDKIGKYMDVKAVKGLIVNNVLYSGCEYSELINTADFGTRDNPTALGDEFIYSIKARFGIDDTEVARDLVAAAYAAGQIYYNSKTDFGNSIGWFANAEGNYISFWDADADIAANITDGVYSNDVSDGTWLSLNANNRINGTDYINIDYDLGANYSLSDASLHIGISSAAGIGRPWDARVQVSDDGKTWTNAGSFDLAAVSWADGAHTVKASSLNGEGRYVRITMINSGWLYINEITLNGTKTDVENAAVTDLISGKTPEFTGIPSAPNGAVYAVRSYGYYGETSGSIRDSDLMYMGVRVMTEVNTGNQIVEWDIPAALIPMINYTVNVSGRGIDDAVNGPITLTVNTETPLRLLYEVGLDDSINRYNIADKMAGCDSKYIDGENGYRFWTNEWEEASSADDDTATISSFTPSKQNKAFYYDEEAVVCWRNGGSETPDTSDDTFAPVYGVAKEDLSSNYYYRDYYFEKTGNGDEAKVVFEYNMINPAIISGLKHVDEPSVGGYWLVPNGTGTSDVTVTTVDKSENISDALEYSGRTTASHSGVSTALGNNGVIKMTPVPEGTLSITKTVSHNLGSDHTVPSNKTFTVKVTLEGEGVNQTYKASSNKNASLTKVTVENGEFTLTIVDGETVDIEGIPENTKYTVTETTMPAQFENVNEASELTGTIAKEGASVTVKNSYEPLPVSPDFNVALNKALAGRDVLESDSFDFTLTRDGDVIDEVTVTGADIINGTVKYLALTGEVYTEPGEYTYTVTEAEGSIPGMSYETDKPNTFTIVVKDYDFDGKLDIEDVKAGDRATVGGNKNNGFNVTANFTNQYTITGPATLTVNIDKLIDTPTDAECSVEGFEFGLYNGEELVASAVTDANGKATITVEYNPEDVNTVFNYVLKEIEPAEKVPGMTYTDKEVGIKVEVVDNTQGNVAIKIDNADAVIDGTYDAEFTNIYAPGHAFIVLDGEKVLEGRDLAAGEFSFNLYETDSSFSIEGLTPIETVKVAADGSFEFDTIFYSELTTKYYVVTEVKGDLVGVEYDETAYNVTVTVTDGNEGELVADVAIADAEEIVFTNVYTPVKVPVTIDINKVIENKSETEISLEGFEFVLSADGEVIGSVKSDINGDASFVIEFSDANLGETYNFTLSEVNAGMPNMTYSTKVYEYTVKIVLDEDGNVVAELTSDGAAVEALFAEFVNTYVEPPKPGDDTNVLPWIAMLAISGIAVFGMFKSRKKEESNY